ncbi:hypothetical protein HAX54_025913, partial [Datura stramonium]|nr:hypothetical protein [Datura stramonium]
TIDSLMGPSTIPSPNQVLMESKFQPIRGGSYRRNERPEPAHHLQDEPTNSKEVFDEGDDFSERGSSLDGPVSDLEKESGNEATRSPVKETKPLREDVIKAKTLGFWESVRW